MNPQNFKKIEEIYHEAVELDSVAQRKLLELRCAGDPALRKEVESLLSIHDSGGFIDTSPNDVAASLFSERKEESLVGAKLGRYSVLSIIGEGGMGEVYLARDEKLKRKVALKVLPSEMVENTDRLHRFVHEARAASALSHPNILTIYEVGESSVGDQPIHYISMEYVEGDIFNTFIYEKRLPLTKLLEYLCQVGEGISKAHLAGIVHRDLKPENIMVNTDGFAKVLDFGLAKLVDKEAELNNFQEHRSRSGVILGTVGYMSPEQAKGSDKIDQRSDIFAFGCILYETIARENPFTASSAIDALHKIIHDDPVPIGELNTAISNSLAEIVDKCLVKNPDQRYQSIRDVIEDLEKAVVAETTSASLGISSNKTGTISLRDAAPTQTISRAAFDQRKQVTLLYADFGAIAELLETRDPEESAEYLNKLWAEIEKNVAECGGEINKRFFDAFTVVWGAGIVREGDPERAIRAALSFQKSIGDYFEKRLSGEFDLTEADAPTDQARGILKIGVDTGMCLVGGNGESSVPTISGSILNAAKRLALETDLGTILISHHTYRHIRGVFDVALHSISHKPRLKKDTKEIRAYKVSRSKPRAFRLQTRGVGGIETKLVGRNGEMDKLLDALFSVFEEEELRAVTVVGEAGLGKSRLLYEFRDRLELMPEKVRVFNARAFDGFNNLPFSLLRDLFSFRFEISETDSEQFAKNKFEAGLAEMLSNNSSITEEEVVKYTNFVGNLIGLDYSNSTCFQNIIDDPLQIRDRALFYAKRFFESVSRDIPIVINLDDLHWADYDSLDFFEQLISELSASKILILGFSRPSLFERRPHWAEGHRNHSRIDLALLSDRETRMLVSDVLRHLDKPAVKLTKLVAANANGNPFYAEELIKMMIDQKIISNYAEKWTVDENRLGDFAVPDSLSGVLQARFDQLSQQEKNTLQYAAIIGFEFWTEALEQLAEAEVHDAVLNSLREKEIIFRHENSAFEDSKEYVFKHAIFREVIYETILLGDRKRFHIRVGDWLVGINENGINDHAAMIAEHFQQGEAFEKAADWYGNAGNYSRKTHSPKASAIYFSKALELSKKNRGGNKPTEKELEWRKRLGSALHRLAKFDEAEKEFSGLLKAAKAAKNVNFQAEAYLGMSYSNLENGNNHRALETSSVIETLKSIESSDPELDILKAKGLYRKARALYSLGKFDEVIELGKEVMSRAQNFDRRGTKVLANSYHILAAANMSIGGFDEAFAFEKKGIDLSRNIGDLRTVSNGLNSIGEQMRLLGEPEKAITYYNEALDVAVEIGAKNSEVMITSNMGGAKILLGEFIAAEKDLRRVFELVGDAGHFILPETYRFLAESLYGQDKLAEALKAAKQSLKLSQAAKNNENIGCALRVIGTISSKEDPVTIENEVFSSAKCFETALQIFEESGMKGEYARTLKDFALVSKNPNSAEMLENAAAIFEELLMENELKKTRAAIATIP